MSDEPLSKRSGIQGKIYSLSAAARSARVTAEFIHECVSENLIQVTMLHGAKGYDHDAVRRLIRIRHLHRDLGLDLTAIDYILKMRRQISNLQKQLRDSEHRMRQREHELLQEIQRLRKRLVHETDWDTIKRF
jgi:DNA-binding transcriptional MerR regulator